MVVINTEDLVTEVDSEVDLEVGLVMEVVQEEDLVMGVGQAMVEEIMVVEVAMIKVAKEEEVKVESEVITGIECIFFIKFMTYIRILIN